MTWTIKTNGAAVAHAAPPAVATADDGTITVTVGAYQVVIGADTAPLRACAVRFCGECERASRLARLMPPAAGS